MVYFKQAPYIPNEDDALQFPKVLNFKKTLGPKGVLFWEYADNENFSALFRTHLYQYLKKFSQEALVPAAPVHEDPVRIMIPPANPQSDANDDDGIMDLAEVATKYLVLAGSNLAQIAEAQRQLNAEMTAKASEIQSRPNPNLPPDNADARELLDETAEKLNQFADKIFRNSDEMRDNMDRSYSALGKAIPIVTDFGERGKNEMNLAITSAASMADVLKVVDGDISSFRNAIERLPRATRNLNKAKRRAAEALSRFQEQARAVQSLTSEFINAAQVLVPSPPESSSALEPSSS